MGPQPAKNGSSKTVDHLTIINKDSKTIVNNGKRPLPDSPTSNKASDTVKKMTTDLPLKSNNVLIEQTEKDNNIIFEDYVQPFPSN